MTLLLLVLFKPHIVDGRRVHDSRVRAIYVLVFWMFIRTLLLHLIAVDNVAADLLTD